GAASRLREELGSKREAFEQDFFDRVVESLRASLAADADAEIQRGRDMSLDEAAAVALAATGDPDRPRRSARPPAHADRASGGNSQQPRLLARLGERPLARRIRERASSRYELPE